MAEEIFRFWFLVIIGSFLFVLSIFLLVSSIKDKKCLMEANLCKRDKALHQIWRIKVTAIEGLGISIFLFAVAFYSGPAEYQHFIVQFINNILGIGIVEKIGR